MPHHPWPKSQNVSLTILEAAKPLLRIHFWLYQRSVGDALFPLDDDAQVIPGPDPERILFVGEIAVAGYGVLLRGMTAPAQACAAIASRTGRGISWSTLSRFDMTVREVASLPRTSASEYSRVVIMLGIPDVLLATTEAAWRRDLKTILERSREAFGLDVQLIVAGIPPMHEFRPIPPVARMLIKEQVTRLNAASAEPVRDFGATGRAVFVRTPDWREDRRYVQDAFSWRSLHELWGRAIAIAATGPSTDAERCTNGD